jgi:hypothetical protein
MNKLAFSATAHCLTGCAIGEVLGVVIGTALGWGNFATIALAIVLAFFFGYLLTMLPLLRSGLALGAVLPLAFASDTLSITVMEIVGNLILLVIPGAMEAGLTSLLFWGSLAFALAVAFAAAFPVNLYLITAAEGTRCYTSTTRGTTEGTTSTTKPSTEANVVFGSWLPSNECERIGEYRPTRAPRGALLYSPACVERLLDK